MQSQSIRYFKDDATSLCINIFLTVVFLFFKTKSCLTFEIIIEKMEIKIRTYIHTKNKASNSNRLV